MNFPTPRGVFFILGTLCLLAGCDRGKGPVVAKVDGSTITLDDLEARLAETPEAYQQYAVSPQGRREFLNVLIREKVVLMEARKAGLQKQAAYRQAIARYDEEARRRAKEYRESLLVESYLRRLRSKDLAATDAEVAQYYQAHRAQYDHPVEIHASHILVQTEAEANTVLDRLKQGASFESLAREFSKDPATASRGGKLTPFRRGTLVPEFEDAAFKLKVGEVSSPVKTPFGFHIIKKTGQTALPVRPFEALKEELRARLEREKFDAWVKRKEADLGVSVDEKSLAAFAPVAPSTAPYSEEHTVP